MKRILILGRFQPPHLGHLEAIARAAARCDEVLVVVGSAQESYTMSNPFTAGERLEMLRAGLRERKIHNCLVVPVVDIHRHAEWVAYVESLLPGFDQVVTNNPLTKLLFQRAGYKVRAEQLQRRSVFEGNRIRRRLAQGQAVSDALSLAVRRVLNRIRAAQRLKVLAAGELKRGRRTPR